MPESPVNAFSAYTPLTDRQEHTIYTPAELWSDDFALKVAVQDFNKAESYRNANHDWRWRTADELYTAWVTQKYWEGTRMPRANIGVFLAFEQIESMLPKFLGAIFADNPWFQADPLPGTTAAQARQWQGLILDQLDKTRVREIYRRAIKSAMVYGNGIVRMYWESEIEERAEWRTRWQPEYGAMGVSGYKKVLDKRTARKIENKPCIEYVSIKDFYIDPNCNSPQPCDGRYVARRLLLAIDELWEYKDDPNFKIPSKDVLIEMANQKPSAQADATKSTSELFRLGWWAPQIDQTVDPGGRRIEVIEYVTKDRVVWVGNRNTLLMNIPNPYGFINYYDAFYTDVLDRFYAMGVCDVLEGEQRLQASLLNGRLDEIAISLHRPLIKKRGINTPQSQMRSRPGQVWEVEDPSKDLQFMDVPNITQSAYLETQASEIRAQKTTGVSDLAVLGTPSGGNSASRTATGVGAQVNAAASRLQYIVENLEDTFIEPMLNDLVKLNQMYPPVGTDDTETVALSRVNISMRASAKMQSRMALMQTFPLVLQTLANPALVSELAMQGVTPDWKELMHVLLDMTGYRNRADLIRPLSPQEMQARQQQGQQEAQVKMQMQRERIQGQREIQRERLDAENKRTAADLEDGAESDNLFALADVLKASLAHVAKKDEKKENGSKSED